MSDNEPSKTDSLINDSTLRKPGDGRATSSNPADPQEIGHYRIEAKLGEGAFGTVYRAWDRDLDRHAAIKLAKSKRDLLPDENDLIAEARAMADMDEHPSIVSVYHIGRIEDGRQYIVSKYIDGSNLEEKTAPGRVSCREAAEMVATVADALHFAHLRNLYHRDIKPSNILVDRDGKVWLTDFGIALKAEDVGRGPAYAGTCRYMSPEQARGESHSLDGRSDIFSLGIVLYELLTGRHPFAEGADAESAEIMRRITHVDVRPPRQMDDAIPERLERICLKCLARDPRNRYQTAKDLNEDLRDYLKSTDAAAQADVAEASGSRVSWRALAGGTLLLAAICILVWLVISGGTPANILSMSTKHYRVVGKDADGKNIIEPLGELLPAVENDYVRIKADLSAASHYCLLSLRPDGRIKACDDQPPPKSRSISYPSSVTGYYVLNEGTGLQAFILVVSRTPLPAPQELEQRLDAAKWAAGIKSSGVWAYNGQQLELVRTERDVRDLGSGALTPFVEACRLLQQQPEIEAVYGVAFPVRPRLASR